jgi:hypothetical protein
MIALKPIKNPILMKLNMVILFIMVLTACADRRSKLKIDANKVMEQFTPQEASMPAGGNRNASSLSAKGPRQKMNQQKLVKNGTISLETNDVEKTRKEIEKLYLDLEGYVASENHFNYGDRFQYEQEIRIPSQNFQSFIQKLEQLGSNVQNKQISAVDVTEEFIDLEARLKTKKSLEVRYLELLKLATKVDEILSIETKLSDVRAEIESMEGRLNFLQNQVAFSTLKISYYELTGMDFGFASKFIHSVRNGWDNLLTFVIALVNIWPFFILAGASVFAYSKYRKRTRAMMA